jgi:hypothetical protein
MNEQSISVKQTADNEITVEVMGYRVRVVTESKINSFIVDFPDSLSRFRFTGLGELKENGATQHYVVVNEDGIVK